MPKFYKQNKRRIDPRYFLSETTNRDQDLEEGYSLDANKDGQLSPDALRRMADELETGPQKPEDHHSRGIDRMVDKLTGQGSHSGMPKDSTYGDDPEKLRNLLNSVLNDPNHGWGNLHPSDFTGQKSDWPMLMRTLMEKGAKIAKEEGKGDRISLPPEEQELYEWLRRKLGYRADMSKGRYVDTKSDMYGE